MWVNPHVGKSPRRFRHTPQGVSFKSGVPGAGRTAKGQRLAGPRGRGESQRRTHGQGTGSPGEDWGLSGWKLVGSPKGAAWQLQLGATPVRAEADSEGFGGWTSLVGLGAFAPCDHYPRCGDSSTQPNVAPPFGGGQFRRVWGGRFSRSSRQTLSMSLRMMEYWSSRLPTRSTACLWERAAMKMVSPSSV